MNTDEDDRYDAHCVNCGAGYHFEVGIPGPCPACGRSQTVTLPADAETFNAFAEEWLVANLTVAQILAIPGVAVLVLEDQNNHIIDAFDDDHEEE